MTKKISFFVVTVAAVALVLSGCGNGPGTDDMDMERRRLDGEWHFASHRFVAMIDLGLSPIILVTVNRCDADDAAGDHESDVCGSDPDRDATGQCLLLGGDRASQV